MGENEHLDNLPLDSADSENIDKVITISDIIGEKPEAEEKTEDNKEEKQLPPPAAGMKEIRLEDVDSSKVKYIDNPLLVSKFGKAGRSRVIEKFQWNNNVEKMIEYYNQIIK